MPELRTVTTMIPGPASMAFQTFRIGFHPEDQARVFESWQEIFSSQQWVEGKYTRLFEEKWSVFAAS